MKSSGWVVAGGTYSIEIGRSAHEIALQEAVLLSDSRGPATLTLDSSITDWLARPVTGPIFRRATGGDVNEGGAEMLTMIESMSMRRLLRFPDIAVTRAQLKALLLVANNPVVRGIASAVRRRKP